MAILIPFHTLDTKVKVFPCEHRANIICFSPNKIINSLQGIVKDTPKAKQEKHIFTFVAAQRHAMLAKIHIALKSLYGRLEGFTEDVYRYGLDTRFGQKSAAKLNNKELHEVLLWLGKLGFEGRKSKIRKTDKRTQKARVSKIEAMLAEKGRTEQIGIPWDYALSILSRQTRGTVMHFEDATPQQLDAVIAALFTDARRHGRKVR